MHTSFGAKIVIIDDIHKFVNKNFGNLLHISFSSLISPLVMIKEGKR
jgi:hypothetical protein